ncbi:hypothetical protein OAI24_02510 [Alphaproteobacteria bacterium]|nr:hypothetical protein [Alphaproteobacteria bacterium]
MGACLIAPWSASATDNQAWLNADISVWGGNFDYQEGEVAVGEHRDHVYGAAVDFRLGVGGTSHGTLSLDYEHTLNSMFNDDDKLTHDDDQTNFYRQIAYKHSFLVSDGTWVVSPYIGVGDSKDFGDNGGKPTDYKFFGLGVTKNLEKVSVDVQLGRVFSSDPYDETVNSGSYRGITIDYEHNDKVTYSGSFYALNGGRFDDDHDYDPTNVEIEQLSLSAEYQQKGSAISYWANTSFTDYRLEDSSDPHSWETRIGLTYHFGEASGVSSRRYLPSLGRWISMSANEIE